MNEIHVRKPPRSALPAGEILCNYCTAKCCRYFALPIDTPQTHEDFQYIRWYLLHDAAYIFIEDGTWHLLVQTECQHLQPDNRCGIYHSRPKICGEYSTDHCEYDDDWTYEGFFETAQQMEEYCEAILARPGEPNFRSPKPTLFPIVHSARAVSAPELSLMGETTTRRSAPNETR